MDERRKLILTVAVTIDSGQISSLQGPGGEVLCIPFSGTVSGELFSGRVCPGAADVQRVNLSGVRHMCARYMLEGTDYTGASCRIFVENNGWFSRKTEPGAPFQTVPTFLTDSQALAPYLHRNQFVGEGTPGPNGVTIRLYESLPQKENPHERKL
jgi:hypothetical protein